MTGNARLLSNFSAVSNSTSIASDGTSVFNVYGNNLFARIFSRKAVFNRGSPKSDEIVFSLMTFKCIVLVRCSMKPVYF